MNLEIRDAELIVGIVARIGVDKSAVIQSIHDELTQYHYKVFNVHVTSLLATLSPKVEVVQKPIEERYGSYITACNRLRSEVGSETMALLAIADIVGQRGQGDIQSRNAFIVDQIKRPEESDHLRNVYGEHYVQISCHADESTRIDRLIDTISDDHPEDPKSTKWDIAARSLVHKDESEEDEDFGQRVRQVFPLSDIIIDASSGAVAGKGVTRFFRALFGDKSVTPTKEEYGMELANTAAQRSSDLSRQVGAAILTRDMEVQAIGCNEVPRAGGGAYWEGDNPDGRDFARGRDANVQRRQAVLRDLLIRLDTLKYLALDEKTSIEEIVTGDAGSSIAKSQLMDLSEYGRSVHAEMSAITDAARVGNAIDGCVLFSNTFPCHNCAKHIVAAGIEEVIYIHPYPKSYAKELFSDSIAVNPSAPSPHHVTFRQFIGIQGPMYARVFTKARWKREQGRIASFDKTEASYVRRTPVPAYEKTEQFLVAELGEILKSKGYRYEVDPDTE